MCNCHVVWLNAAGMTLLKHLKSLFTRKSCVICKKGDVDPESYYNDEGEAVLVCRSCVPYAERRAMRKR
ncbi:hypothetical protein DYE48_02990 [Halobacillus trueperi]|uniref:Uncharacterized protein n=1 Tax=Halobacillus trueperi TaxID=156205 RepID=A0A3E0JCF1_9BACI|nr:hypothetical protein DYE48_02990 [Halobacillus trueperi]